MAVKLVIKNVKDYRLINLEFDGKKLPAELGIKLYDSTRSEEIQEEFKQILQSEELEMYRAKAAKWEKEGDKTDEDFFKIRKDYQTTIDSLTKEQDKKIKEFYRSQVLFVRNSSVTITENGQDKDIIIADSRTATPIESLWATPEECLVVLLDAYFEVPALRDSLTEKVLSVIFNSYTEEKGKNSK
jgi:hypothetical protein